MGMEQVVGVAYGVSFAGDELKDFLKSFAILLNRVKPDAIDNVDAFVEYPQEGFDEIIGLDEIFNNVEFDFWYDENNGEDNLLISVKGSHKSVMEKYVTVSPTKLGRKWDSHQLEDTILSATGYGHLSAEWIFYAYVN
jgi:hypothetical protein